MPKTTITHVGPFMDLLEQMGAAAGSSFADVEVAEQVWVMVQVRVLEAAHKPADRRRSSDQRRADMAICAA